MDPAGVMLNNDSVDQLLMDFALGPHGLTCKRGNDADEW